MTSSSQPSRKLNVLSSFLNVEPDQISQYKEDIFSWRDVLYQVVLKRERGRVSLSHFVTYKYLGKYYHIREIGPKSSLYMTSFPDLGADINT